ncbi:MAG: hypothetical protein H7Z14_09870 [Anaerolineae bacterium]|nr:hypothetical protein [Phycisphaerae bacterium]
MKRQSVVQIESLESRQLLAATLLTVVATQPDASESNRTTTGKGVLIFSRIKGDTSVPLTIKYAINGLSTAQNSVDFETLNGRVTIPAGKRSVSLGLVPINDSIDEPIENVQISIKDLPTYSVKTRHAYLRIKDNDPPVSTQGWWNTSYRFRAPITVDVGSFARADHPVEQSINFTPLLSEAGGSGALIDDSIRVIETSADGKQVLDANVAFQFDKASNFNATSNAAGKLVFIVKGSTSASTTRKYHVYFDTAGTFTPFSFSSQVITDSNSSDEGQSAIKITTDSATYWLQKENGGFSSIEDADGNDWLGFNPSSGSQSAGEYRGTPNMVFPGGGLHPGFDNATTAIIDSGPLKTTIETTASIDKQIPGSPFTYKVRYEIYGTFVRTTVVEAGSSYWFLYEGTPGGSIDGNDTVVRSDGQVTDINTAWNDSDGLGSGNGEEWLYFRDSGVNRFMYYVHNTPDNLYDMYRAQNDGGGAMTVFGFGRDDTQQDPNRHKMTSQNNVFTFGIAGGGGDFNAASAAINGTYRDVTVTIGGGQQLT